MSLISKLSRPNARRLGAVGVALVLAASAIVARAAASGVRVAVIDFQPSGAVGEYETLGAGLQSMLTTDLSAVSTLTVVERARLGALQKELKLSRSAWADPKTALKVGKLAGASHLVMGSFTLVGSKMRLDARMVEVATAKVLFATKIEGEKDAFFELEKQLAGEVIKGVGITPSAKERSVLGKVHTADLGAFQKFSEGVVLFDEAQYERSLEALKEASKRDDDFKLARTTLDSYERLSAELRNQANVIEAQQTAEAARLHHEELSIAQKVQQRLIAVADKKGGAKRDRAAALYFLANMEDVSDDSFADARMRALFATRYMQEFSGLFPQFAVSFIDPFGERYGEPKVPEKPEEVDAAIAAAGLALTFSTPKTRAEDTQNMRQESVPDGFTKRTFERLVTMLPLDFKGQTDYLQRLYELGKNIKGNDSWRVGALKMMAERRRGSLEVAESTRLFHEAALHATGPSEVRSLAKEVDENAEIDKAIQAIKPENCLHDVLLQNLASRNSPRSALEAIRDQKTPCASSALARARLIHDGRDMMIGNLPTFFVKRADSTLWSGPRSDAERSKDFRYYGAGAGEGGKDGSWAFTILEGVPRLSAELSFELSLEPAPEAAEASKLGHSSVSETKETPRITVFFGARNVLAQSRSNARGDRSPIPMQASGITIAEKQISAVEVRAELKTQISRGEKVSTKQLKAESLTLARKGKIKVNVRREPSQIVVSVAGKSFSFAAPAAEPGFIGLLIDGPGYMSIAEPQIAALK